MTDENANSADEQERERIRRRRAELGNAEIRRRETLYRQAQEICFALIHHPNVAEARPMLKLAEELREQLNQWTWGE